MLPRCPVGAHTSEMATDEHTCTEMVKRRDLDLDCGRFIAQGVQRHVAFVVLEEILQQTTEAMVTVTLTISREDYDEDTCRFTALGKLLAAHA
jgi:hypothetical protein